MTNSSKKVLFVCIENSNRSQLAEAFVRIHGADQVEAFSAGSRPSGKVNPKAIEAMKRFGYDLSVHYSKSLDEIPQGPYDFAITMGCGDECPMVSAKSREDWQIADPRDMTSEDYLLVLKDIENRVLDLLSRM